jgi:hypothetical protein
MEYTKLLNKSVIPTEKDINDYIGNKIELWRSIHKYVSDSYDYKAELAFWTKKYGWTVRYKKGEKTLCYFFPENNAFSILIVLGIKESEIVNSFENQLNKNVRDIFNSTEQLRDGKWIWIRVLEKSDIDSFIILLNAKRKPIKASK